MVPEPLPRFPFVAQQLHAALEKAGADPTATIISVSELEDALRAHSIDQQAERGQPAIASPPEAP